jgi:hypothetical protein
MVSIGDTPAIEGAGAGLTFDSGGNVSGSTGCNSISGSYALDGSALTFGPLATTRMACEDALMAQEAAVLEALAGVSGWEIGRRRPAAPDRRDRARPPTITDVRLAHVRERHAPSGAPWRLAAALDADDAPKRWLDLECARRRAVAADPGLAHNEPVFRRPITTLDDHLAAGLRVEALRAVLERFEPRGEPDEDDAVLADPDLAFGPPVLHPPSLRDFYAFERHVGTMWSRRGAEIPEAWFRLPIFYFSNVSEIRGTRRRRLGSPRVRGAGL